METPDLLVLRDLDPRHVQRKYGAVLEQLRRGDFRSAEVKKLQGRGLYRARLDEKDRLLFTLAEHAGRRHLLLLEVVRNHEYEKARFLNGGTWTEGDFVPVASSADEPPVQQLRYLNPASPSVHFLDKPLSFDDAQAAVFETPLPLVVVGSAGSGKTALMLEKLKTLPGHGLYLTRSSYLVESARSLYGAHGYQNAGQEVEFLSLAELLETIAVPAGRAATFADFGAWWARVRTSLKLRDPHKVYEEIHGVLTGAPAEGPWMEEAEYLDLGVRQSIFLGEERRLVYAVFQRWRAHLKESGLFDTNVAAWERSARARSTYDFLVIDEVQDVTMAELKLALATLRDPRQLLLCGDSNQIVHPNLFSWARVKSLFWARAAEPQDRPLEVHVLSANYRNTRAVTEVANRLLLVKQRRFGSVDRESNYLVESVGGEEGRVELRADEPGLRAEIDASTRRSTRYAVIVLREEDKAAARAAFSTPLLFSVQEAKGLEYENVVLFNLVASAAEEFAECAAGVAAVGGDLQYGRARDKADKSLDAYKFYVNALYVAMTRAVKSLLMVEEDPAHPLFALLAVERGAQALGLAAEESSREDWQREARRLELQGKTEQAEQIRRDILETAPVPWPVADAASLAALRERALLARDKPSQQLLFEYAVTYDAPALLPKLVAAGFRHARSAESGRAFIESTHYSDYRAKRPLALPALLRRHGVDFRNPVNETPLMVAARTGRPDLVADLLAQGADPELLDTVGRDALRVALASWLDGYGGRRSSFPEVWALLRTTPLKVRYGARMVKLDPRSMEWFLVNLYLVHYRRLALQEPYPHYTAPDLEGLLRGLPSSVLPEFRKKRTYISSMLAKNEVTGTNPYNRFLFLRLGRGRYILHPALRVEVRGEWVAVAELMQLDLLADGFEGGRYDVDFLFRWLNAAPELAGVPGPDSVEDGDA